MLLVHAEPSSSTIHGEGLFARQKIPAGSIVIIWEPGGVIEEHKFIEMISHSSTAAETGIRWVGKYFSYADRDMIDEEKINHSNSPNMICFMSCCFALCDIEPGDELTFDYRYVLPEGYEIVLNGSTVVGLSPQESFLGAISQLGKIVNSTPKWVG